MLLSWSLVVQLARQLHIQISRVLCTTYDLTILLCQPSPSRRVSPKYLLAYAPLLQLPTSRIYLQGGVIEVGAPTGKWQLIVVYRGKHCPVSRNYLASLQQIIYELDDLGVEVLALTADGREKAEAFVSSPCATSNFSDSSFLQQLSSSCHSGQQAVTSHYSIHQSIPWPHAWLYVFSVATKPVALQTSLLLCALCVGHANMAGCCCNVSHKAYPQLAAMFYSS